MTQPPAWLVLVSANAFLHTGDFVTTIPSVIIFGEDESTLPVTFRLTDDSIVEAVEEFRVSVRVAAGETGASVGTNDTATVSIEDNDG